MNTSHNVKHAINHKFALDVKPMASDYIKHWREREGPILRIWNFTRTCCMYLLSGALCNSDGLEIIRVAMKDSMNRPQNVSIYSHTIDF